jgi:hypothetical protein
MEVLSDWVPFKDVQIHEDCRRFKYHTERAGKPVARPLRSWGN